MSLDMSDTGGQCDAASRLFQTRAGRGRYVLARVSVCRVRIQSSGGSCTGDQGSSELVSPLKAFLPLLCGWRDPWTSSAENFEAGQRRADALQQKCESLIPNNCPTRQRMHLDRGLSEHLQIIVTWMEQISFSLLTSANRVMNSMKT